MTPSPTEPPRRRALWYALAGLVLAVGLLMLASVGPAGAQPRQQREVTAAQAADLARQAVTDDQALAELRRIQVIDGRRVDLAAATAGLGRQRAPRLRSLAAALDAGATRGQATPGGAEAARRSARDVLDQSRYQERKLPRPFSGVLRWLGDKLDPVLGPIGRFFGRVFGPVGRLISRIPGGNFIVGILLAGVTAALISLAVTRRSGAKVTGESGGRSLLVDLDADPAELDRSAEHAEAAGDLDRAVRLRYEAGLIRLVRAGMLDLQADTTASRVAAEVGGDAIETLTRTFERVVYGGETATASDVVEARAGWLDVLANRSRR